MNRRGFLGWTLSTGLIFVPKYDRWFREGRGVWVKPPTWVYETRQHGDWTRPMTWRGGKVPTGAGEHLRIGHQVTIPPELGFWGSNIGLIGEGQVVVPQDPWMCSVDKRFDGAFIYRV